MRPIAKTGTLSPLLLWLFTGCAATSPAYVAPVQPARGGDAQVDQRMSAMEGRINDMSQRLDKVDGAVAAIVPSFTNGT